TAEPVRDVVTVRIDRDGTLRDRQLERLEEALVERPLLRAAPQPVVLARITSLDPERVTGVFVAESPDDLERQVGPLEHRGHPDQPEREARIKRLRPIEGGEIDEVVDQSRLRSELRESLEEDIAGLGRDQADLVDRLPRDAIEEGNGELLAVQTD